MSEEKPKKKLISYGSRTLKVFRDLGYAAGTVEKWNPHAKIRQDLFGIVDIVAVGGGKVLWLQVTGQTGSSKHREKLEQSRYLDVVSEAGSVVVVSWHKRKVKRGGTAFRYEPKFMRLTYKVDGSYGWLDTEKEFFELPEDDF